MTVTKIESPYLDRLVAGSSHDEFAVLNNPIIHKRAISRSSYYPMLLLTDDMSTEKIGSECP